MATKTFKTRIKLKYDLQSAWENKVNPFSALNGELLLGKDNDTPNTVFANVGTEAGIKPLSIRTGNVLLSDNTTLTDKLTAIDTALGASGSVANQITTAINTFNISTVQPIADRVEANETAIEVINNNLTTKASQADLETLEGRVETAEGEIDTLQTDLDTAEDEIDTLQTEMDAVEGKITTLEGKAINETVGDNWVSVELSSNKLTVTHKPVSRNTTNGTGVEVGSGSISNNFTIPNLEFDNTGHVTNFGTTTITVKTPNASDLGLSNALHFRGVVEFNPAEEATTVNYKQGDVVLFGDLEYVLSGEGENAVWVELGNASANAAAIADLQDRMDTAETEIDNAQATINTLNGADTVNGSVANSIKNAIEDLDVGTFNLATVLENEIQITGLQEVDGKIGKSSNTVINVDGTVSNANPLATTGTVATAVANASLTIDGKKGNITTGNGLTDVLNDGGSFGVKISESSANGLSVDENGIAMAVASNDAFGTVKVSPGNGLTNTSGTVSYAHNTNAIIVASVDEQTNVVTINGTLTPDASDNITGSNNIQLASVAKTGDVNDLSQGNGNDTYIIFDCGDADGWAETNA